MKNDTPLLLKAEGLNKIYSIEKKPLHVLKDINLEIFQGETLGVVGESGCGKSTLGKILLRLETPSSGYIQYQGKDIHNLPRDEMRHLRRKMQMIFQDPYASLNPRMTIEEIVSEGLVIHGLAKKNRQEVSRSVLSQVGLDESMLSRYPHEFSGGQRQRIGIARALVLEPQFIVCDEPLSALDACTQNQVMQLLLKLKRERKLTYLFISHDLRAVRTIADKVAVMYLGKIVEQGPVEKVFSAPQHPYTQALLSAIPIPDPRREKHRLRIILKGELPSALNPPSGCPFHPRCLHAMPICRDHAPQRYEATPGHFTYCHTSEFTSHGGPRSVPIR